MKSYSSYDVPNYSLSDPAWRESRRVHYKKLSLRQAQAKIACVSRIALFLSIFFSLVYSQQVLFNPVFAETPTPTVISTPTPIPVPTSQSSSENEKLKNIQIEISVLESKVGDLRKQSVSLASEIAVMDNQIKLTQLRINATEEEMLELNTDIDTTSKKIVSLEGALSNLTKVLIKRIVVTYQVGSVKPLSVLAKSGGMAEFLTKVNYLGIAQSHDKELLVETQQAKNDYANQKSILEDKRKKVEELRSQLKAYNTQLDQDKKNRQNLLQITQNDEKKYQSLLAIARSEYQAIQGIIAGNGQETLVGDVVEGQRIATLIPGPSCNSGGEHLHFIVNRGGSTESPFNYLKSGIDYENCSGGSCGSSDGDSFNPSGSWNWPLDPKIKLSQGYGSTWATRNTWVRQIYSFHNGIDIQGSSIDVKAVQSGKLYQGSYSGANCRLRYVKLDHNDSDLETYYLHVNYIF